MIMEMKELTIEERAKAAYPSGSHTHLERPAYIKGYTDRSKEDGWQRIETAPKDGSKILAACIIVDAEWHYWPITVSWRVYHPNAKGKPMFRDVTGVKCEHLTHWKPLPQPRTT